MAVQIVATGLSGIRYLRQSQHHMDESFIEIYGSYAIKLLKMQNELLQVLDRYRRGHHQTVEVHHVHLHSGSQGVIGVVNPPQEGGRSKNDGRPHAPRPGASAAYEWRKQTRRKEA